MEKSGNVGDAAVPEADSKFDWCEYGAIADVVKDQADSVMTTDKSWIRVRNRNDPVFLNGLENFIETAKNHLDSEDKTYCPCKKCVNSHRHSLTVIKAHIHDKGFQQSYETWIYHGEELPNSPVVDALSGSRKRIVVPTQEMFDALDDVMAEQNTNEVNIDEDANDLDPEFDALFAEVNTELYPGCTWLSSLNFLAKMTHFKVINKWTDSSFSQVLEFLKFAFPKENHVPASYYEAKKKLRKIGLGYQSIDACVNDCVLFWKDNESKENCPVCNASRWVDPNTKGKKIAHKVMRYFPLTSRLRRRYGSRFTAKDMIWHNTGSSTNGMMRHPVDGKAWQEFDKRYPDFAKEPRNVRLGLAADGFNPFGIMSLSYKGIRMRDASTDTIFNMRAALLWTINGFPARSSLSGWSGQGYKACSTYKQDTPSIRASNKTVFIGHRRFLPSNHKWRFSLLFNGNKEKRKAPRRLNKEQILEQLNSLPVRIPGKHPDYGGAKRKRAESELNWTKRSIFFELDYWSTLELKHNLDVMHVEKNVCESLLGTLLMNDKSKDTNNARVDLKDMGIRKNLWLTPKKNKKEGVMAATDEADRKRFEEWKKKYNKAYKSPNEEEKRFSAFQENLRDVEEHLANKNLKSHWKGAE
ncbi:uncharacterized protein LOC143551209 [Bidens hawaiensis]|uniref:uncharacterized protein LOC143551209 n=1 Tax=Bidens hawaiensis TaxID=980011 RepID=UPI0040490218